jgi:hypothetical protein
VYARERDREENAEREKNEECFMKKKIRKMKKFQSRLFLDFRLQSERERERKFVYLQLSVRICVLK